MNRSSGKKASITVKFKVALVFFAANAFFAAISVAMLAFAEGAPDPARLASAKHVYYALVAFGLAASTVLAHVLAGRAGDRVLGIARRLQDGSRLTSETAGEISASSGELSDAATAQAAAIQETAAA